MQAATLLCGTRPKGLVPSDATKEHSGVSDNVVYPMRSSQTYCGNERDHCRGVFGDKGCIGRGI